MALSEAALAAIAAGATATGAIGSAGIAGARNMRIAKYSADFQRQQIQEQNEYNSPLQQMKRYQEAGLNPNLIYGDGASSTGNQSQIAHYQTPELPTPDLGTVFGSIIDSALRYANQRNVLKLQDQELQNKREEQFRIRSERMAQDIENMYKATITGFDPGLLSFRQEREQVLGSMRLGRYKQELLGIEELNNYRVAQTSFMKANKKLLSMKSDAQEYYNRNIQPLVARTMEAAANGREIENQILEIKKKFATFDKYFGYGQAIVSDILRGISAVKSPPIRNYNNSYYNMDPYTGDLY